VTQTIRRYAFVSDAVYPFNKGGKETRLHEITERLASNPAAEVHIYTMKWWDGPNTIRIHDVSYHAICKLYPLYTDDRRSTLQALMFGLATLRLVVVPFDVLDVDQMPFLPLFSARLVCVLRRRRLFGTWHEVWGRKYWRTYMGPSGLFGHAAERLAFQMPHTIISNSEHTTARLRAQTRRAHVETVPLGVDIDRIKKVSRAERQSDVIFAGRLLRHKNVDLLIAAVALIRTDRPHLRCLIVGEGPERSRLEAQSRRIGAGDNVEFLDFVAEHDELLGLLKSSRVLALPSEREGFGMIILEANACGLPAVTLDHDENAARDLIVPGRNGFLCQRTAGSLAAAIVQALDTPIGDRSNEMENDWSAVATRVEQIYSERMSA
jgi:glycosyltransferase involved in cell wall biosynthesis